METFTGQLDTAFSILSAATNIKLDMGNPKHKAIVKELAKKVATSLSTFTMREIESASGVELEVLNNLQLIFTAIQHSDTPDARYFIYICTQELDRLGGSTSVFITNVTNSPRKIPKILEGGAMGPKSLLGLLFILMFISFSINSLYDPSSVITAGAITSAALELLPFNSIKDIFSRLSGYKVEDYVPSNIVLGDGVVKQDPKTLEQGSAWDTIRINAEALERDKENARAILAAARPVQEGYMDLLAQCSSGRCGTPEESALAKAAAVIVEAKQAAPKAKVAQTALSTEYAKATAELAIETAKWSIFSNPKKIETLTQKAKSLAANLNATGVVVSVLEGVEGVNPSVMQVFTSVGTELRRQAGEHAEGVLTIPGQLTPSGRQRSRPRSRGRTPMSNALSLPRNNSARAIAEFKPAQGIQIPFPSTMQLVTPVLADILSPHPGATFDMAVVDAMMDVGQITGYAVDTVGTAGTVVDTEAIGKLVGEYFPSEKNSSTAITPRSFFAAMATEAAAKKAFDNAEARLAPFRAERAKILDENFISGVQLDVEHVVNGIVRMGFKGTREEAETIVRSYLLITRGFKRRPSRQNDLYASAILDCLRSGGKCPKVKISDLNAQLNGREALLKMNFIERLNHASGTMLLAGVVLTLTYVGVATVAVSIESAGMVTSAAGVAAQGVARRIAGPQPQPASASALPAAPSVAPIPPPTPLPRSASPAAAPARSLLPASSRILPTPSVRSASPAAAPASARTNPQLTLAMKARANALAKGNAVTAAWYNSKIAKMAPGGGARTRRRQYKRMTRRSRKIA